MNHTVFSRQFGRAALLLSAAALPAPVFGALTWNSTGTTDNWSTAAGNPNWLPGNVLWTQNESAIFDATSGTPEVVTVTTANVFNDITFDVDGFTVANGAGSLILANDQASTITVTNAAHTGSVLESLANSANGISTLTKAGAGTLLLGGSSASTYTGQTFVNAGTLKTASATALGAGGAGAETLVADGATLDVNGQALANTEVIRITGTGVGGNGALVNNGAAQNNALNRVELTGNATIGGTARFDVRAGTAPTLDLAGNTITKVGTNLTSMVGATITNGNIVINGGSFGIETTTVLQGTGTVTVNNGGTLGFWANTAGNVTRPIVSNNGTLTNLGSGGTVDSPISIAGGTTFATTGGITQTFVGNITGTGPASFSGTGAFSLNGTNSYTGGTVITDARVGVGTNVNAIPDGTVTINGDGVVPDGQLFVGAVTMPATKDYAISGLGGNSIDGAQRGALRLDGGSIIEGNIVLNGNAGFGTNNVATDVGIVNGDISGAFGVTKLNAGIVEFAGVNTYTGATTVSGGTLRLNYDIEDSSKLSDTAPLVFAGNGTISLAGGTHEEIVQSTTLNAGATGLIDTPSGIATIDLGAITRNPKGTLNIIFQEIAKTSSGTVGEHFGSWLTVQGLLATKNTSNFLVPVTPDDYSTVLGPAIPDGAGHVNLIDSVGTVALGGNPGDVIDVKTISRSASGTATIDTTGKTLRLGQPGTILSSSGSGGITFGTAANAGTLTAGGPTDNTAGLIDLRQVSGTIALRSTVADNGTGAVTLATRGTVLVTGTNTYTGGTVIEGFYHGINSDAALGALPATFDPDNVILDGGTLSCYSGAYSSVALNANRGITLTSGGGSLDAGGGQTLAINGIITGPGNISTNTGGIIAFNGLNTYTGATTVGGGTTASVSSLKDVADVTGSSFGNPATATTGTISFGSNSKLLYTGTGSTTNRVLALTGTAANNTATIDHSGTGVLRFTSALTATGASIKSLVLDGSTAGTGEIAGVIPNNSATNTTALAKNGSGTWSLQATNTYTGNTTVNAGVLDLGGAYAGASGKIRGSATVNAAGTLRLSVGDATGYGTDATRLGAINLVGGTLDVNTTSNQTLGSAVITMTSGSITGISGSNLDFFAGASALNTLAAGSSATISGVKVNLRQNNGVTFTVADGPIADDLVINSVVSSSTGFTNNVFTKAGAGTLRLNGANTYTTGTIVNAGKLLVSNTTGSGAGTGAVTVNTGGTVGGTGSFTGALTVNTGATVAPGASAGTLGTGAAVIDGTYACEIDGANADKLAVTGNLDIDGATLNVSVLGGGANQPEYIIATYTGTLAGIFTGLPESATVISGYTITYATAGQIKLVGSASPYTTWASSFTPNPGAAGVDFEGDGFQNGIEFILGGSPVSGSNNPKVYSLIADSSDVGTDKELILTIAVPVGTPPFVAGAPATSSFGGFGIAVRGSTTLNGFTTGVTPVTPVTTGLPTLTPQGGVNYEYRSFSLDGSNGTPTKGFIQVEVTNP